MNGVEYLKQVPAGAIGNSGMLPKPQAHEVPGLPVGGSSGFGDTLKAMFDDVNEMQLTAETKTQQFATGEIQDIHEVMAAAEEASISMMLLMEVRNKLVDGYKELMRTPV